MSKFNGNLPIVISIVSMGVALFTLGWNIFRDVILKARVKVRFRVKTLVSPMSSESPTMLVLSVLNLGPGNIKINSPPKLKKKKFLRKAKYAVLVHDYLDPLSAKIPCEIEVGDEKDFLFQFNMNCFLKEEYTHFGIKDSFGRTHWASRRDFKATKGTYKKWFEKDDKED